MEPTKNVFVISAAMNTAKRQLIRLVRTVAQIQVALRNRERNDEKFLREPVMTAAVFPITESAHHLSLIARTYYM